MIVVARSHFATDDRDKIYGLLGLCPAVVDLIKPDYAEPIDAIYIRAALEITKRLGALMVFNQSLPSDQNPQRTPSLSFDFVVRFYLIQIGDP
jgi:hypothetical protein